MDNKEHVVTSIKKYDRSMKKDEKAAEKLLLLTAGIATVLNVGNFGISFDSLVGVVNTVFSVGGLGLFFRKFYEMVKKLLDLSKLKLEREKLVNDTRLSINDSDYKEGYIIHKINKYDKQIGKSRNLAMITSSLALVLQVLISELMIPEIKSLDYGSLEQSALILATAGTNVVKFGSVGAMLLSFGDMLNLSKEENRLVDINNQLEDSENIGKSRWFVL